MRAIDTNVLIRLLVEDNPAQVAKAPSFIQSGAWVSVVTIVETVWVLSTVYNVPATRLGVAAQMLLDHQYLTIQEPEVVAAALLQFRKKPTVGFSDCLMLELARRAGNLPLGTFDRNLAKLDGAMSL